MAKRSLQQIEESLRAKLTELYDVPLHDIDLGADLDIVKRMQDYRQGKEPGGWNYDPGSRSSFSGGGGGGRGSGGRVGGGKTGSGKTGGTPKVQRRVEPSMVDKEAATAAQKRAQELLTGQGFKDKPKAEPKPRVQMKPGETQDQAMLRARREEIAKARNDQVGAKVWRPGGDQYKVWRRGSEEKGTGKESPSGKIPGKEPPISTDKPFRPDIPGPTDAEKKWSRRGSAAVHTAAALAAILGLKNDKDIPPPGGAEDSADQGVTWIDTKDFVPTDTTSKDAVTEPKSSAAVTQEPATAPEAPIPEPDIRLEPVPPTKQIDVTIPDEKPAPPERAAPKKEKAVPMPEPVPEPVPVPVPVSEPKPSPTQKQELKPEPPVSGPSGPGKQDGPGGRGEQNLPADDYRRRGTRAIDIPEDNTHKKLLTKYKSFLSNSINEEQDQSAMQKFLDRVTGAESGGKLSIKNPWSPATGLFQFMPATWKGIVQKAKPGDPHYGVTFDQMKTNAAAQIAAAKAIAQEYAAGIRRSGMPNIPTSYYLFHGHGPKAVKLYNTAVTNPKAVLQDIYPEYVKNPKTGKTEKNIVYIQNKDWKPDQNLRSFVSARARKMGDKLTDVFPSAQAGELPPDRQPAADTEVVPSKKEIKKPVKVPVDKSTSAIKKPDVLPVDKSTSAIKKPDVLPADKSEPANEKPVGSLVKPDWSKYNFGDLGTLEKTGPGEWKSLATGQIIKNASELEKLPNITKPESFLDKVQRTLPPFLGGGGELVSKVFGDKKKSAAPTKTVEPAATPAPSSAPKSKEKVDPAYEPGTAEYDERMEKLQTAAGDKFSQERAARLKKELQAKSKLTVEPPDSDPETDPKAWAEYDKKMQKIQTDAGDKFSQERAARLASSGNVTSLLQKDQAGLTKAKRELTDFEKAFAAARAEQGAAGTFQWKNPKTGEMELKSTLYKGEKPPVSQAGDQRQTIDTKYGKVTKGTEADYQRWLAQQDSNQPPQGTVPDRNELADQLEIARSMQQQARRKEERKQDMDRVIQQLANEPVATPTPRTADELASDELWKDIRADSAGKSSEELSAAAKKAMQELEAKIAADQTAGDSSASKLYQEPIELPGIELKGSTEPYVPPIDVPIDSEEQIRRQSAKDVAGAELKEAINTESNAALHDILRLAGRLK